MARTAPAPPPDVARSALAGARTHADCAEIRSARGSAAIRGSATRPKSTVRPSQERRMRLSHFSRTGLIQFHICAISFTKCDNYSITTSKRKQVLSAKRFQCIIFNSRPDCGTFRLCSPGKGPGNLYGSTSTFPQYFAEHPSKGIDIGK